MNEHSMIADIELYATAEAAGSSAVRIHVNVRPPQNEQSQYHAACVSSLMKCRSNAVSAVYARSSGTMNETEAPPPPPSRMG